MFRSFGFTTGFFSFCAFIACFGALHLLNKFNHTMGKTEHISIKVHQMNQLVNCNKSAVVDNMETSLLTWNEIFYIKWSLVLTLLYVFVVLVMLRAKFVCNFELSLVLSNMMLLSGLLLTMVMLFAIIILTDHLAFMDYKTTQSVLYLLYFIALDTFVSALYFLICSCQYYFGFPQDEL